MNTALDFYPAMNGVGNGCSGEDAAVRVCNYDETVSPDRLERATLAKVDSQVLLRELLRRIGEDPDRRVCKKLRLGSFDLGANYSAAMVSELRMSSSPNFMPSSTTRWYFFATSNSIPPANITCCRFLGRRTLPTVPIQKIVGLSKLARLLDIFREIRYRNADPANCQRAGALAQAKRSRRDDGG